MNIKQISLYLSIIFLTLLCACGEDRSGEYEALIAQDKWIKDQMDNIYLWYYEMPSDDKLSFFAKPEEFFKSLLYKKDKYSYLETVDNTNTTKSIDRKSTYGFDFLMFQPTQTPKQIVARVLFVLRNSPAEKAGLKRGNWITKVNDEVLTKENYGYLYNGDAVTFTLAQADTVNNIVLWKDTATVNITASNQMESNPFYIDTIYHLGGKNIAYMMYNSFSTGPQDTPYENTYNDQMRSIFGKFKSNNINDFILDLRYNQGGYLSCSQVLSSLLAPADKLGQPYCSLAFNGLNHDKDTTYTLRQDLTGGNNLNLNKLYVIVTNQTASASETVINCLRPYMDVILIGTKTEGKNVASLPISTEMYPEFILHPIVAYVNNSEGKADYADGITPDYVLDESENAMLVNPLLPLGDTKEYLLKNTLTLITTGSIPGFEDMEDSKSLLSPCLTYFGNSMDNKKAKLLLP